jgi:hypothetical protein
MLFSLNSFAQTLQPCNTPTRMYWMSASLNPVCPMKNGSISITVPGNYAGPIKITVMYRKLGTNDPLVPYDGGRVVETTISGTQTFVFGNLDPNYYCFVVQTTQGCFNTDVELNCCVPVRKYWAETIVKPLCPLKNGSITMRFETGQVNGQFKVTLLYRKLGTNDPLMPYEGGRVFEGNRLSNAPTSYATFNNLAPNYYCFLVQTYQGCFNIDVELNCDVTQICTYTQGGWGSAGGKMSDGMTATKWATKDLINLSLARWGGTLRIGCQTPGGRSLLITTAEQVLEFLPNGGPSIVLTHTGELSLSNFSSVYGAKSGSLIAQTITLGLNLKVGNMHLKDIPLEGIVNAAVIAKLTNKTVGGLYEFANNVLCNGLSAANGLTLSQIAEAIDAINNYFHECKTYQAPGGAMSASSSKMNVAIENAPSLEQSSVKVSSGPNPFRNNVRFVVESKVSGQGVLEVYNMAGVKLATPFRGFVTAGKGQVVEYKTPSILNNGLVYVFRVNDQQVTGKMVAAK